MTTQTGPNVAVKDIDFGEDHDGFINVKLPRCKAIRVCPAIEVAFIHQQAKVGIEGQELKGVDFVNVVRDRISQSLGGEVDRESISGTVAMSYYDRLVDAEQEIRDFFFPSSDSPTTSNSTQEAAGETGGDSAEPSKQSGSTV